MKFARALVAFVMLGMLAACGGESSDRPRYSGHEESTAGVPGWTPDGKRKLHPNIKLGQSYTVGGKTYVPRYQPDYDEVGMASWYGPGFHGGRTANGETFSTHDRTAAHTTLPLPSIVKVTYLKTGRSTYARINDRGPFAHGRIIDLNRAVAEDIGMIRDGVGKVRVQYMPAESEKFVELMAAGRAPQSIDLAREVIGQAPGRALLASMTHDAAEMDAISVSDTMPPAATAGPEPLGAPVASVGPWAQINPVASARAAPSVIAVPVQAAAPASASPELPAELPPPELTRATPASTTQAPATQTAAVRASTVRASITQTAPASTAARAGTYVQLGAFANAQNAQKLKRNVADLASAAVTTGDVGGVPIYRVRLGPFASEGAAVETLARARARGYADAKLVTQTQ